MKQRLLAIVLLFSTIAIMPMNFDETAKGTLIFLNIITLSADRCIDNRLAEQIKKNPSWACKLEQHTKAKDPIARMVPVCSAYALYATHHSKYTFAIASTGLAFHNLHQRSQEIDATIESLTKQA